MKNIRMFMVLIFSVLCLCICCDSDDDSGSSDVAGRAWFSDGISEHTGWYIAESEDILTVSPNTGVRFWSNPDDKENSYCLFLQFIDGLTTGTWNVPDTGLIDLTFYRFAGDLQVLEYETSDADNFIITVDEWNGTSGTLAGSFSGNMYKVTGDGSATIPVTSDPSGFSVTIPAANP